MDHIKELNFDEIERVDGGLAPVVVFGLWFLAGIAAGATMEAIDHYWLDDVV